MVSPSITVDKFRFPAIDGAVEVAATSGRHELQPGMREDESQILIPPSFQALYTSARGRLTETVTTLRERYELCEDLAQQLIEHAQAVHFDQGVSEDLILQRVHAGLRVAGSGVSADEAVWVATRLAELLRWDLPNLGT